MINRSSDFIFFIIEYCKSIVIDKITAHNDIFEYTVDLLMFLGREINHYYNNTNALKTLETLNKTGIKKTIIQEIEPMIFYSKL